MRLENQMTDYQPPFQITDTIINNVAQISELMGRLSVTSGLSANPILRRENRIRTIHGSLAIEQNTLSLEQVTAVLKRKNGASPRRKTLPKSRMPTRFTSIRTHRTRFPPMICWRRMVL